MAATEQRIFAMGGASVLPSSTDWPMYRYLLDLTGQERPRICFLGTASGDEASYRAGFYATFARQTDASHLALFDIQVADDTMREFYAAALS